jgi:hypothetical protein
MVSNGEAAMKAKTEFNNKTYTLTPALVDRIVCFRRTDRDPDQLRPVGGDGAALLGIDRLKRDVFSAADVPELTPAFQGVLDAGFSAHDIAVIVKIPKDVRRARAALKPE